MESRGKKEERQGTEEEEKSEGRHTPLGRAVGKSRGDSASVGAIWHEAIRFGELLVRRERSVGGRHGHVGRVTLLPDFVQCEGRR